MEMPKPGPEHAKLAAMIGHWVGEEKMYPSPWLPEGGMATSMVTARLGCEGFCVLTDYVQEREGKTTYVGHGVFGWDPRRQRFVQHWSDSAGGVPSHATPGTWEGDTLTFLEQGPGGHMRFVYRFTSPDSYEFRIDTSADGVLWAPFVEARYVRQAATVARARAAKPKSSGRKLRPKTAAPKRKPAPAKAKKKAAKKKSKKKSKKKR